ncbi:MAG: MBOAT family protein [Chthoniobacterales bacterium]|nr:MBOAT family protein [Chthoniobacterales bacterium]
MLFVEARFFFFFAIVFSVAWMLRSNRARKAFLLVCNYVFYSCFFVGDPLAFLLHLSAKQWALLPAGWWFPFVLLGSTGLDYLIGLRLEEAGNQLRRRGYLLASLTVNIGTLCIFKYLNFLVISGGQFLAWIGLPASYHTLRILLPYGVSFYTFQSISYTVEVYRRHLRAERSFLDLAFFIGFFPALVAGPIVRATYFLPQTKQRPRWREVDVRGALVLFLVGFVKKACVADSIAPFVDQYFAAPASFTAGSAWLGVLLYAVQIYCDFSGYTDMAIAVAGLLGYRLTINFNFPYFANSITDFWRRWHISLSSWLRDYLYISLGGNRGSKLFTYRNLLLTMLLGGLWHGASWVFVLWGGLHGLGLIVHREWTRVLGGSRVALGIFRNAYQVVAVCLTFYFVCVCWVFFRAGTLDKACVVLRGFVLGQSAGTQALDGHLWWLLGALTLVHWLNFRGVFARWWRRIPEVAFASVYGAAWPIVLLFTPAQYVPFIYFQF